MHNDMVQYLLPFAMMRYFLLMMWELFTRDDVQPRLDQLALNSPMRNSTAQRNGRCKSSSIKNIERDDSTAR